jgi:hypothetical protein
MAAAATRRKTIPTLDSTQSTQIVRGTVTLTGSYPAGGDTLNLAIYPNQSHQVPVVVWFTEAPSSTVAPSGYNLYYEPGTNASNGLLRITSAAGTELTATTYPAALLAANIIFEAIFPLGI